MYVLKRYDIVPKRVEAIDVDDPLFDEIKPVIRWRDSDVRGNAKVKHAVFLSHLKAWEYALSLGSDRVMICEDDIYFHTDWITLLHRGLEYQPSNNLFMLNATRCDESAHMIGFNRAERCVMGGCYLIHRDALSALIDKYRECPEIADMALSWYQGHDPHRSLVHYPYLAMQVSLASDVQLNDQTNDVATWCDAYMDKFQDVYDFM